MGCKNSKAAETTASTQAADRRAKQAEKRRKSQDRLRPEDANKQEQLQKAFSTEKDNWPSRPPWYLRGKHTQGINILIAAPEPLRETYITVVARNDRNYTVQIGYGKETKFDVYNMRFSIACSTVSMQHAKLHFKRENGLSRVEIEDCDSLNGTFVLGRPPPQSTHRPMLEKEVRGSGNNKNLDGVEYIRLGSACVLVLDSTNIFWDDEEDEDDESEPVPDRNMVKEMFDDGWYFPMPCPPKLAEITQKKREVVDTDEGGKKPKQSGTV